MAPEKDRPGIRGAPPESKENACWLRKTATPAEKVLWQALRGRQLDGLKFRRQHPLGAFIVDFCCPVCKLVVELDGSVHDQQQGYDQERSEHIEGFGYTVIRFANNDVLRRLPWVLEEIRKALTPDPSPDPGRGE